VALVRRHAEVVNRFIDNWDARDDAYPLTSGADGRPTADLAGGFDDELHGELLMR
jgi:hypothetical protein